MDLFNDWTMNESEIFSLVDLLSPTIPSDPTPRAWQWSDHPTTTEGYTALDTDGRGLSNNNHKSSEASDIDSSWGEKVAFASNSHDNVLEIQNQGHNLVTGNELNIHRIQRRRIQNRNAQRNFRQRQENERQRLAEKLMAAEQQCSQLSKICVEMDSVVNSMRDRMKRLEAENSALRTSVYSVP